MSRVTVLFCAVSCLCPLPLGGLMAELLFKPHSQLKLFCFFSSKTSSAVLLCWNCYFILGFLIQNCWYCSMSQEDSQVKGPIWHVLKLFKQVRSLEEGLGDPVTISAFCMFLFQEETLFIHMPCRLYYFTAFNNLWISSWDIQLQPVNKKPVYLGVLYIVD